MFLRLFLLSCKVTKKTYSMSQVLTYSFPPALICKMINVKFMNKKLSLNKELTNCGTWNQLADCGLPLH